MLSRRFFTPLIFSVLGLTGLPQAFAIVGGTETAPTEAIARSTVRLLIGRERPTPGVCTGSLIAPRLILTAAHCLAHGPFFINIGFYEGKATFHTVRASRYLLHPDHGSPERAERHDLALVYFSSPIPEAFSPIHLLPDEFPLTPTIELSISGFGTRNINPATYNEADNDDSTLHTVNLRLISKLRDSLELKHLTNERTGNCHGDSGGPAWTILDGVPFLVGTASYFSPPICGSSRWFSSIPYHSAWIQAGSELLRNPPPYLLGDFNQSASRQLTDPLVKQLMQAPFDSDRLILLDQFRKNLKRNLGVPVTAAAKILPTFSLHENRLEALKKLKPHLRLKSRTEARELLKTFQHEHYIGYATKVLKLDGVVELKP